MLFQDGNHRQWVRIPKGHQPNALWFTRSRRTCWLHQPKSSAGFGPLRTVAAQNPSGHGSTNQYASRGSLLHVADHIRSRGIALGIQSRFPTHKFLAAKRRLWSLFVTLGSLLLVSSKIFTFTFSTSTTMKMEDLHLRGINVSYTSNSFTTDVSIS